LGNDDQGQTLLILGDSLSAAYGLPITQSWASLLQQRLHQANCPYQVINASISGETSGGGLARLEALLQAYKPELLLLELGANDGLRGFPVSQLKQNLEAMIEQGKRYKARILLIGIQIPPNYGLRYTHLFEQTFTDLAQKYRLPLLPSLLGEIPLEASLMQDDGLHPNSQAQPLILGRIWPVIEPLLDHCDG
jgi:acyl-CoA thioesterase-1